MLQENSLACPPRGNTGDTSTRGLRLHSMRVGVDWLRLVMPQEAYGRWLESVGDEWLGETRACAPLWFFERAVHGVHGAKVLFDGRRERGLVAVDLPAVAVERCEPFRLIAEALRLGGRVSRLDVALDVELDEGAPDVCDLVLEAARAGEACGFRSYREIVGRRVGGDVVGRTVYLGARGKGGSGRFVRVYDKGLESKQRDRANRWMRLEIELTGPPAAQSGAYLVDPETTTDDAAALVSLIERTVDFREQTNGGAMARRSRLHWWAQLLGHGPFVKLRIERRKPKWDSFATWVHKQVGPTICAVARRYAVDAGELSRYLISGSAPSDNHVVVGQAAEEIEFAFRSPSEDGIGDIRDSLAWRDD